jgi:multiple antibiotic resistance protein
MSIFTVAIVLFLIMDPIGNIAYFLKVTEGIDPKRQRYVIFREMFFALLIMIAFNYIGEVIFSLLQLSETTVRLSSGIILFLIALQILFPSISSVRNNLPKGEPFVIPLAVPLIAGPSLVATIMLYAHLEPSQPVMLEAIFFAWLAASIVLMSSGFLSRVIGKNGLLALEKLMGMILILLAIQRFLDGIRLFTETYASVT